MIIFVGSTNPVKVNAVTNAASETWPAVQVKGLPVPSGIADQPFSDEETKLGSINRAQAALTTGLDQLKTIPDLVLGVGLEGGVMRQQDELWTTVWASVVDRDSRLFSVNGARFRVPDVIAKPIIEGEEMGLVMDRFAKKLFPGRKNSLIKQEEGAIGVITSNFVDRTEEYAHIAKLALGLWYGRDWSKQLK